MTTEERTATTEDRLDDIAARLAKLEALLGDKHLAAGLEAMRFDGYAREHLGERMRQRAEKEAMFSGVGAPTEEELAQLYPPDAIPPPRDDPALAQDETPF